MRRKTVCLQLDIKNNRQYDLKLSFSNSTMGVYTLLTTLTQAKGITFYHSITDRIKDNIR